MTDPINLAFERIGTDWLTREHSSRQEASRQLVDRLQESGLAEPLATVENRRQFLLGLSWEKLCQLLSTINHLSQNLSPSGEMQLAKGVVTPLLLPPDIEDKPMVLSLALESTRKIMGRETEVEQQLEDVALLWGGVINYTHCFPDGNGRTSRIMGYLLRQGLEDEGFWKKLTELTVNADKRYLNYNSPIHLTSFINSEVRERQLDQYELKDLRTVYADVFGGESVEDEAVAHLSEEARRQAKQLSRTQSGDFGALACSIVMAKKSSWPEQIQEGPVRRAEAYFEHFQDELVESAGVIQRLMLRERMQVFIDAIENPQRYQIVLDKGNSLAGFEGRRTTIRDYYREYTAAASPEAISNGSLISRPQRPG